MKGVVERLAIGHHDDLRIRQIFIQQLLYKMCIVRFHIVCGRLFGSAIGCIGFTD